MHAGKPNRGCWSCRCRCANSQFRKWWPCIAVGCRSNWASATSSRTAMVSPFEDSLTRKRERIDIPLLLHALAVFAAWLAGMAAEADGYQRRLNPFATKRRLYSSVRLGWEALARRCLTRLSKPCWTRLNHSHPRPGRTWLFMREKVRKPQGPVPLRGRYRIWYRYSSAGGHSCRGPL